MKAEKAPTLEQTLLHELDGLGIVAEENAEKYAANADASILEIRLELESAGKDRPGYVLLEDKEIRKALATIAKLKARPRTGRAKELRRIQNVLDELLDSIGAHD